MKCLKKRKKQSRKSGGCGTALILLALLTGCTTVLEGDFCDIYLPVFLIPFTGMIIDRLVVILMARYVINSETALWLDIISRINSFCFSSVVSIIVIIIFYKNRNNEKIIPKYWLVKTAILIFGLISVILYSAVSMLIIYKIGSVSTNQLSLYLLTLLSNMVSLAIPVYVLVRVLESSRRMQAATEQ